MALPNELKMKVTIDESLCADSAQIAEGATIQGSNKLVDMNVLAAYDKALKGSGLGESFDTLKEIQTKLENIATEDDIDSLFIQEEVQ